MAGLDFPDNNVPRMLFYADLKNEKYYLGNLVSRGVLDIMPGKFPDSGFLQMPPFQASCKALLEVGLLEFSGAYCFSLSCTIISRMAIPFSWFLNLSSSFCFLKRRFS
jgi:hypothetical protein